MSDGTTESLSLIYAEICKLKKIGWRVPHPYTDSKEHRIEMLEAESTGVFVGHCESDGSYWIHHEADVSPSWPMLVRSVSKPKEGRK